MELQFRKHPINKVNNKDTAYSSDENVKVLGILSKDTAFSHRCEQTKRGFRKSVSVLPERTTLLATMPNITSQKESV